LSEVGRIRARKKIKLPSGDTIYIPCIKEIHFLDAAERGQETQITIDNSSASDRKVHVDKVKFVPVDHDGNPTGSSQGSGPSLYVERIDQINLSDSLDRGQETQIQLDNNTGSDSNPPRFTTHKKTHVYRYYKDPNSQDDGGTWIDVEMIDELDVSDASDRGQETFYALNNPEREDMSGQSDDGLDDITIDDGEGTEGNPIRIDPYQNIINFNGGIYFTATFGMASPYFNPQNPPAYPIPQYAPPAPCASPNNPDGIFTTGTPLIVWVLTGVMSSIVTPDGQTFQPPTPSLGSITGGDVIQIGFPVWSAKAGIDSVTVPESLVDLIGETTLDSLTASAQCMGVIAHEQACFATSGGPFTFNYVTAPGEVTTFGASISVDFDWSFEWAGTTWVALGTKFSDLQDSLFWRIFYVPQS
jgi:hypothetical protein